VGGQGTLASDKPVKTIGRYWPYATTEFDYVRRSMPFQSPQSLSNDDVYSVTAYLLSKNDIVPADATLDAKKLAAIKMPNRDNFYVDDRPDTKNERCMADCLKKQLLAIGRVSFLCVAGPVARFQPADHAIRTVERL